VIAGDETSDEERSCCIFRDASTIGFMSLNQQKSCGSWCWNWRLGADTFQLATLGFRHHKANKEQCQDAECSINAKGGSIPGRFDERKKSE
jgi:hypothetical protein